MVADPLRDKDGNRLDTGAQALDDGAHGRVEIVEPAESTRAAPTTAATSPTDSLDVSGSGAFADFEIRTVTETNAGPFDASGDMVIYDLQSGDYTVRINNFAIGDIFVPFAGATVTVVPDENESDGVQPIEFGNPETGETVRLELAGLSAAQDSSLFNQASIDEVFGSGTFGDDFVSSGGAGGSGGVSGSGADGGPIDGNVLVNREPADTIPETASTLTIASGGDASVELADGATRVFTSDSFDNVNIATTADVVGDLALSGDGTRLVTAGTDNTVQVGRTGTGNLTVEDGADVSTLNFEVAGGGTGTATIRGQDSRVVASNDNGLFSGDFAFESGFVRIGEEPASAGTVEILNGGELAVRPGEQQNNDTSGPGISLGEELGSSGDLIVDGAQSLVDIEQESPLRQFGPFLEVGEGLGQGDVTVRNGATVSLTGPDPLVGVSDAQSSGGGADDTTDTSAVATSTVRIASGGELELTDTAEQGARSRLFVGQRDGAEGKVTVTGDGSAIDLSAGNFTHLALGGTPTAQTGGTGRLTVADGGTIDALTLFTLGEADGGFGVATLSGVGSSIDMSGDFQSGDGAFMQVGRGGTGALTVKNGADLTIDGGNGSFPGFNVGRNEGASGKLRVSGEGSRIDVSGENDAVGGGSGFIAVGRAGFGYAMVENGGEVVNDPDGTTFIGREASATGIVSLRGGGARFDAGEQLVIGADFDFERGEVQSASGGTGRVRVDAGAVLEAGTPDDGAADVIVGAGDTLSVEAGATLRGDVLNAGGTVEIASGATFVGELLETDGGDGGGPGSGGSNGQDGTENGDTTLPSVGGATFSVADDVAAGTAVGTVEISDNTGVSDVRIAAGNVDLDDDGEAAFSIASDGTLNVNDADDVDFDTRSSFNLTIAADDAADNTGTASVTVDVTNASGDDLSSGSGFVDTEDADTLVGTDSADTLALVADGQDDSFDAKDDFARDTLDLSGLDPADLGDAAPKVDLSTGVVSTTISGTDDIANFDTVIGTDRADTLVGRDTSPGVLAGASDPIPAKVIEIIEAEQFIDGGGDDTLRLRGGQGTVTLSPDGIAEANITASGSGAGQENALDLSRAAAGVNVDIAAQGTDDLVVSGGGLGDQPGTTVAGFNSVEGSDFDDVLSAPRIVVDGGGADDVTLTSGGDSVFYPSADGVSETVVRAQDAGTLNLIAATSGATVDLSAQGDDAPVLSGGGLGDQPGTSMSGFVDVRGSSNADTIVGDAASNLLVGSAGDDQLDGGPGADTLIASNGADTLTGGPGADRFDPTDFQDLSQGINRITDFQAGQDDVLSLGRFGAISTADDITAAVQPGVSLQDPTKAVDGFFADAGDPGATPNLVIQDDGADLTRVFIDGTGDGNYTPGQAGAEDSAIELTGTIQSTGIDTDAITAL
jgi:T5SS/PEP-CTERM-associated repeat protein